MRPSELVRAVTSKVIVALSYNLVKMFIMMSRRVAYNTHDYVKGQGHTKRSKVKIRSFIPCLGCNFTSYCCISMILGRNVQHHE